MFSNISMFVLLLLYISVNIFVCIMLLYLKRLANNGNELPNEPVQVENAAQNMMKELNNTKDGDDCALSIVEEQKETELVQDEEDMLIVFKHMLMYFMQMKRKVVESLIRNGQCNEKNGKQVGGDMACTDTVTVMLCWNVRLPDSGCWSVYHCVCIKN